MRKNYRMPSDMTRTRLMRGTLIAALACAVAIITRPALAENWSSLAYIPNTQVSVSFDKSSIVKDHGLTRAWFLFTYPIPVTTAESYVLRSYKQHEIIDCKLRGSFTAAFIAYSDADAHGRVIDTWTGPTAVMPALNSAIPGTMRALMIDAACAPPAPQFAPLPPLPPAPASTTPPSSSAAMATPGVTPRAAPAIGYPTPGSVRPLP